MSFKHGASGYRRHRCRCEVCRAGKAAEQRAQRAKAADGEAVLPVALPGAAERAPESAGGSTQAKTAQQIEDMAAGRSWSSECARLEDQALTAARVIDTVIADGRVHLAPAHFRLLNDAMERLQALLTAGDRQRDDDGPRSFEDRPEFSFMRTCNSGWFPRNEAGVFEPVQRICTLARGHEGPHSDGS